VTSTPTRNDAAIVTAIVAMARSLDLKVTAEGVETYRQAVFLRSLACDLAQGFYFGRPVAAPRILVATGRHDHAASCDGRLGDAAARQMTLAMMLMLSASTAILKTNARKPCTRVRCRMRREVTATSETCEVMPITNEKYAKSR
jgi:hypothetical protein